MIRVKPTGLVFIGINEPGQKALFYQCSLHKDGINTNNSLILITCNDVLKAC